MKTSRVLFSVSPSCQISLRQTDVRSSLVQFSESLYLSQWKAPYMEMYVSRTISIIFKSNIRLRIMLVFNIARVDRSNV